MKKILWSNWTRKDRRTGKEEKKGYCLKNLVKNPFFMIENGENAYVIKEAEREQTTLDFLPSMKKES